MDIILEDNNDEEPKYIVSYDPIKDDVDESMNASTLKVEDGVAEKVSTIYNQLPFPKLLDELVEYSNREYILNSIRTVQKKTKEELEEEYRLIVTQGPSFMDYGKRIGNSNIYHFDLPIPWHTRYFDAMLHQYYKDLGDGWYILITINKESGIVAAFKIFDKEFDINSDADTKGDILHLYTGNPKDMHEVEEVIKLNLAKNMHFVSNNNFKEYKPIIIGNPAPSIMDFVEHGRKMEMHVVNAFGVGIKDPADYIGAISEGLYRMVNEDWQGKKHFDWYSKMLSFKYIEPGNYRKLAKRRRKPRKYSFYVHNKLMKQWETFLWK